MEGPSLVIFKEELQPFLGKKPIAASGSAKFEAEALIGQTLHEVRSWGKLGILIFDDINVRIHFLMFGSYRIDAEREGTTPKLQLRFGQRILSFYSCSVKKITDGELAACDPSIDLMADEWDPVKARRKVRSDPERMVCDVLMDQNIFAGLGNIMKNEVQFLLGLHPKTRIGNLSTAETRDLVNEARTYAKDFYRWKKAGVLKKNWQIFRKRKCGACQGPVTKEETGLGQRISHYCPRCQAFSKKPGKSLVRSRASSNQTAGGSISRA